jgi:hypothetical protein
MGKQSFRPPESRDVSIDGSGIGPVRREPHIGEGVGHDKQLERHLAVRGDHGLARASLQLVALRLQVVRVGGGMEDVDRLDGGGTALLVPEHQVNPVGQLLPVVAHKIVLTQH